MARSETRRCRYCCNPTRRRNSPKRGSERREANPGSVFEIDSWVAGRQIAMLRILFQPIKCAIFVVQRCESLRRQTWVVSLFASREIFQLLRPLPQRSLISGMRVRLLKSRAR